MKIIPTLNFAGQCREAIQTYAQAFGGSISCMITYAEANDPAYMPLLKDNEKDYLYHAELILGTQRIIMSDHVDIQFQTCYSNFLTIFYDDKEEVEKAYALLKEGSKTIYPIGGSKVNIPLPGDMVSIGIDLDGTFYFGIGKDITPSKLDWKNADLKARKEFQDDLAKRNASTKLAIDHKTIGKEILSEKKQCFESANMSFTPYACAMLQWQRKSNRASGGVTLGMQIEFKYEAEQVLWEEGLPCYIGLDFSISAHFADTLGFSCDAPGTDPKTWFRKPEISKDTGLMLNIHTEIGLTAGCGVPRILYVAIRGYAFMDFTINVGVQSRLQAEIGAGVQLKAKFILFSWSKTLYKYTYTLFDTGSVQNALMNTGLQQASQGSSSPILTMAQINSTTESLLLGGGVIQGAQNYGQYPQQMQTISDELSSLDENIRILKIRNRLLGFWIANVQLENGDVRPRLLWVNLLDGTKHGLVGTIPDNEYVYDFDIDCGSYEALGADPANNFGSDVIGVAVVSGTRDGVKENPTEEERTAQLTLANSQKRWYTGTMVWENEVWPQAIRTDFWQSCIDTDNEVGNFVMPRVKMLTQPYGSGADMILYTAGCLRDEDDGYYTLITAAPKKANQLLYKNQFYFTLNEDKAMLVEDMALYDALTVWSKKKGSANQYAPPIVLLARNSADQKDAEITMLVQMGANQYNELVSYEGNISTMTPLNVAQPNRTNQQTEGLLFLEADTSSDGSLLKAIFCQISNDAKISKISPAIRSFGILVSADRLSTCTFFIGDEAQDNKHLYAYWPQSSDPSSEEPTDPSKKHEANYRVRACMIDWKNKLASQPFTLLQLTSLPLRCYLMDYHTSKSYLVPDGYFLTSPADDHSKYSLVNFRFTPTLSVSMGAVTIDKPVITAGDPLTLTLTVTNTGSMVVDSFDIMATFSSSHRGGGDFKLTVNAKEPLSNAIQHLSNGIVERQSGFRSLFRIPNLCDDLIDSNVKVTEIQYANGGMMGVSSSDTQLNGFLPGTTQTFQATITSVPTNWKGNYSMTTKLLSVSGSFSLNTMSNERAMSSTMASGEQPPYYIAYTADADTGDTTRTEYYVDANGNAQKRTLPQEANTIGVYRYNMKDGQRMDEATVPLVNNDLTLNGGIVSFDTKPYASLFLSNYVNTSNEATKDAPILVATIEDDGQEIETYRREFELHVHDAFGYMTQLPLQTLTGGRGYEEIKLSVISDNAKFDEFDTHDNTLTLHAITSFSFLKQPQSVTVYDGETATLSVEVSDSNGPFTYQWQVRYPDGTWRNVPGATSPTLSIPNATQGMSGRVYWCVVYDSSLAGRSSSEATLNVLAVPNVPVTGDSFPLFAILVLLCASALTMLLFLKQRNKMM
ncbi:MAG: hypothetical protein PHI98_08625 [Eubacteriales bacterium]|nr:hypothetical protein [Eubacteriales bacterium]